MRPMRRDYRPSRRRARVARRPNARRARDRVVVASRRRVASRARRAARAIARADVPRVDAAAAAGRFARTPTRAIAIAASWSRIEAFHDAMSYVRTSCFMCESIFTDHGRISRAVRANRRSRARKFCVDGVVTGAARSARRARRRESARVRRARWTRSRRATRWRSRARPCSAPRSSG